MAKTFDEIRAFVTSKASKRAKIDFLKQNGYDDAAAESTYQILMTALRFNTDVETTRNRRFTIGLEIEATNVNRNAVIAYLRERGVDSYDSYERYNHEDSASQYKLMRDGSLDENRGDTYDTCEIVSPILRDLSSLKVLCEALQNTGAGVNKSCGLHVHFGAARLTPEQVRRIYCNYARIETIIDSFMPASRRNNYYCSSVKEIAADFENSPSYYSTMSDMVRHQRGRYYKVNLKAYEVHKTIEFRQHSGTINFTKMQNWVNFLTGLINWSLKHSEPIVANTIDELPFLTASQKRYFNARKEEVNS